MPVKKDSLPKGKSHKCFKDVEKEGPYTLLVEMELVHPYGKQYEGSFKN